MKLYWIVAIFIGGLAVISHVNGLHEIDKWLCLILAGLLIAWACDFVQEVWEEDQKLSNPHQDEKRKNG